MEEIVNRYQEALSTSEKPVFEVQSFEATKLPILRQENQFVLRALHEYSQTKGFFRIHGETVSLTYKGIAHTKKFRHDWD